MSALSRLKNENWELRGSVVENGLGWTVAFVLTDEAAGEQNGRLIAKAPALLCHTHALLRLREKELAHHGAHCVCCDCEGVYNLRCLLHEVADEPKPTWAGEHL